MTSTFHQSCTFLYVPAENITIMDNITSRNILLHFTYLQTTDDYLVYLLNLFTNVAFKLALIISWRGVTSHYIAFVVTLSIRFWSCCNTDSNFFSSFPDNLKLKTKVISWCAHKSLNKSCHCRIELKQCESTMRIIIAWRTIKKTIEKTIDDLLHGNLRALRSD